MIAVQDKVPSDIWSDWLLHRRHAGDAAFGDVIRTEVEAFADRVLDGARLSPGMKLLDIGSGEGVVAFRAIDRVGPDLQVVLTDISRAMLHHAQTVADQRHVNGQCIFLEASAEQLSGVTDASMDAVTARSVLAYVADKEAAFRECHRVLKPGGWLSIAEPVFRDEALAVVAMKQILDARPSNSTDSLLSFLYRWKSAQFPDTEAKIAENPLTNYGERDLVRFAQHCGFREIHLALHIDVRPSRGTPWKIFLEGSPHPWAPPLVSVLAERFDASERALFEALLRPKVESGGSLNTGRMAYLAARKAP